VFAQESKNFWGGGHFELARVGRRAAVVARVVFGSAWGGLLVMLGVLALAMSDAPRLTDFFFWSGLALIAAGNWLFVLIVANRLVRLRWRLPADIWEISLMVVFAICLPILIVLLPGLFSEG